MKTNKISVVIPIYNAGGYLEDCLDSLLSQSFTDFEAICVNDGSTDNSLEILNRYAEKDSRISILDGPNGGYGKAMNRGMNEATGKYFAILEPDDLLPPNAYKTLYDTAEKHQVDFVRGTFKKFVEQNNRPRETGELIQNPINNKILCPRENMRTLRDIYPATWCGLYNLNFLKNWKIDYNETSGASYQDVGFFLQTFTYAEKAIFIKDVVYLYRLDNPNSSSNTIGGKPNAMKDEYTLTKHKLERTPVYWNKMREFYLSRRLRSHVWMYNSIRNSVKLEYLTDLRTELIEFESINITFLSNFAKQSFESLLISVDCYLRLLERVAERKNTNYSSDACRLIILLNSANKIRNKYLTYKIKKMFSWGKRRKHLKGKINKLRLLLKEIKDYRNSIYN